MPHETLAKTIDAAFEKRDGITPKTRGPVRKAVEQALDLLDSGKMRVAEKQADGTAGRILGVHMAGPWVTEQLGQAYLAVNWEASVDEVAGFLQPHPSLSESFGEAVLSLTGRSLNS